MQHPLRILTIAGSDSGGGAGIQADIKTISALGGYAMSAITAITAQNTVEVRSVHALPLEMIRDQMCAVFDDLGVDAAKTGMLATQAIIETVAEQIASYSSIPLVVDPVMVSTSGARLLEESAIDALKQHLFPLASVITPNIPEAEILLQFPITPDNMAEAARQLGQRYAIPAVLLKGGHLDSDNVINVLYLNHTDRIVRLTYPRITSHNTHGTGCTLAAALATRLADPACTTEKATQDALDYVHGAILGAAHWRLGKGHGPTHFFWQYHEETD